MTRSLLPALVPGLLFAACTESTSQSVSEARGKPSRGSTSTGVSCTTEESAPAASGTIVLDPTGAAVARVEITNTSDTPRMIGARLRTVLGGTQRVAERAPIYVRPGATASHEIDLRELGIDLATATLPSRLTAALMVHDVDGNLVERVATKSVDVGPSVNIAFDALLRTTRLRARDLLNTNIRGLTATIVTIDKGDTGLFADELLDPDEGPFIPPNYSNAVPDENGLYHHNFCLRWPMDLVDAGFGEDYGTDPEGAWKARGGKVRIVSHDNVLFDDFLDENGCTGTISTPYHTGFMFIGFALASVGNNTIIAKDGEGKTQSWVRLVNEVGGTGTKYYNLAPGSLTNLVAVPAFTLARFGGVSNEMFVVNEACYPEDDTCCNCAAGGEIWISSTQRKFLIAHEMGHQILALRTGGYDNDCDLGISTNHPCYSSSGHAIDSLEYQSCAAMEGWAHFVAVRTFNNHVESDNPGAVLQYWRGNGLTVDVEEGPAGGVDTYYETMCGGNQPNLSGWGVELDWLRAWWDYHTNPGSTPSQSQMMDEIAANSGWFRTDTYDFITDGIEAVSGAEQRDRWIEMGVWNGIDH